MAAVSVACALALAGCSASASSSSSSQVSTASSVASSGTAVIDLDYNAGTGYEWTYSADPEGIVELASHDTGDMSNDEIVSGGPLQDHFTFNAVKPGEVVLTFELVRSWEPDDPAETQVYAFTVTDDLKMILNPYKSDFENEPTV